MRRDLWSACMSERSAEHKTLIRVVYDACQPYSSLKQPPLWMALAKSASKLLYDLVEVFDMLNAFYI